MDDNLGFLMARNAYYLTTNGAPVGPSITSTHRRAAPAAASATARPDSARTGISKNRKNTEFRTILEMGLREAYPGHAVADPAYEAFKDTHTEHPAALGSNRG
jgi:hypothetical protein